MYQFSCEIYGSVTDMHLNLYIIGGGFSGLQQGVSVGRERYDEFILTPNIAY